MLTSPRPSRGALPVGLLLSLIGAACEPRVEEPPPAPRTAAPPAHTAATTSASAAPSASGTPSASSSAVAAEQRCIKPTPDKPTRKVTLAGTFDPKCPADNLATPPKLRGGKLVFLDGDKKTVEVEIAEKDAHRMRGLMFRKAMAEDHGMIFVFEQKMNHAFWMENTCIPLDMLYIDDDGLIVGIEENTPTMSRDTFSVGCVSKYVLELNAGYTRKHGIKAGQRVRLDGV